MVILIGLFSLSPGHGQYTFARADTIAVKSYYVDGINGSDMNPGTQAQPWNTIQKAVSMVRAGDTVYVRGGQYETINGGWVFSNSGTASQPITLTNYPGEQVVFKITQYDINYQAFRCWITTEWLTPRADYIRLIGTDVGPRLLSNGVQSSKGLVVQGPDTGYTLGMGVRTSGCDYWEVAGMDFVDVGYGIFTKKNNRQTMQDNSPKHWYVHDNRVYGFWGESGMQFNGDYNRVENNEIYKVKDQTVTPYGCQALNFLGHHNTITGNTLVGTVGCSGVLFEWDLSDYNVLEKNRIVDGNTGVYVGGGDNNIIRNNLIYRTAPDATKYGIIIFSADNRTTWPCDEETGATSILPANDPSHPDYPYYYNPRNCHSYNNQIYNNVIDGYGFGIQIKLLVGENTVIRNNAIAEWGKWSICYSTGGACLALPGSVMADNNVDQGFFGFVDLANHDFHLAPGSPLIDAGFDLTGLVPDDYDGTPRPQGLGFDIGAFEYIPTTQATSTP